MKLTIKPKAELTSIRSLRMPVSLNERMTATAALADELRVDYQATLLAALDQFDSELNARLREMKTESENHIAAGTMSGTTSDSAPIPRPIAAVSTHISNGAARE
jgi:hypothetical protein